MAERFPSTRVSRHPLAAVALGRLRATDTLPAAFRQLVGQLATLLLAEATADLPTAPATVTTPLGTAPAAAIAAPIVVVPILRAGLGMLPAAQALLPEAPVWHLGLYRDEATLQPVSYYERVPALDARTIALVLDPMLATGGSALAAARLLQARGVTDVRVVALLAAPEGLRLLQAEAPSVRVWVAAVDDHLDARGFIVPGLGDAGDRQFGT